MTDKIFVDTNVLIYALDGSASKHAAALDLLSRKPVISVQVVNETINVQVRKLGRPLRASQEVAMRLLETCEVVDQTVDDIREAIHLCAQFSLSHWDALIVASAKHAGCARLYSEDMQHGMWVTPELQILNPFAD